MNVFGIHVLYFDVDTIQEPIYRIPFKIGIYVWKYIKVLLMSFLYASSIVNVVTIMLKPRLILDSYDQIINAAEILNFVFGLLCVVSVFFVITFFTNNFEKFHVIDEFCLANNRRVWFYLILLVGIFLISNPGSIVIMTIYFVGNYFYYIGNPCFECSISLPGGILAAFFGTYIMPSSVVMFVILVDSTCWKMKKIIHDYFSDEEIFPNVVFVNGIPSNPSSPKFEISKGITGYVAVKKLIEDLNLSLILSAFTINALIVFLVGIASSLMGKTVVQPIPRYFTDQNTSIYYTNDLWETVYPQIMTIGVITYVGIILLICASVTESSNRFLNIIEEKNCLQCSDGIQFMNYYNFHQYAFEIFQPFGIVLNNARVLSSFFFLLSLLSVVNVFTSSFEKLLNIS